MHQNVVLCANGLTSYGFQTEGNGMENPGNEAALPSVTATPSNVEELQTFLPPQASSEDSSQSSVETGLQVPDPSNTGIFHISFPFIYCIER